MKICLIGEYLGDLDEAMRIISFRFAEELGKNHKVLTLDIRDAFRKPFWKNIREFRPDVIHYLHGPSINSFMLLKLISLYSSNSKTVVSATHPYLSERSQKFFKYLKPDVVLTQSTRSERLFTNLGCRTEFLSCGVDTLRFKPPTNGVKAKLRMKYGIDENKYIMIHVGSIKEGRNVQILEKLNYDDTQILIAGAVSTGIEQDLAIRLRESNCIVFTQFFPNIEEIYMLADCYVFPTPPENSLYSIEMPLSVLEAMATNLPIIATRFGALPRAFENGQGFFYIDSERDLLDTLKLIRSGIEINTRNKVIAYSWENIVKRLVEVYESLQ